MYEVDKYTVSLLHFDNGIKDETGKVWAANGSPVVSGAQYKIGGKSLYLDGSSYIKTNFVNEFNLSSGDFTIDWWEYRNDSTRDQVVFQIGAALVSGESICVSSRNENVTGFISSNGSWNVMDAFSLGSIDLNKWNHFALVRSGNSFYTFKNGTLTNSLTVSSDTVIKIRQSDILIGSAIIENASSLNFHFNGYIDEFRISNIARWTENFDPDQTEDGKFLLTITLAEEVEREYPVTKDELDAFIKWYDSRENGTGSTYYTFDKFLNRKDYIVYDKILTFEVTEFSK